VCVKNDKHRELHVPKAASFRRFMVEHEHVLSHAIVSHCLGSHQDTDNTTDRSRQARCVVAPRELVGRWPSAIVAGTGVSILAR